MNHLYKIKSIIICLLIYISLAFLLAYSYNNSLKYDLDSSLRNKANIVVSNAATGIETFINGLIKSIKFYAEFHENEISRIISSKSLDKSLYAELKSRIRKDYPELNSFTFADKMGNQLITYRESHISKHCEDDLKEYARNSKGNIRRLHVELFSQHFDIMTGININGEKVIFFANFNPVLISDTFAKFDTNDLELLIVNTDTNDLIEFTTKGPLNSYKRNWKLTGEEAGAILAEKNIQGSKWKVIAYPNADGLIKSYLNIRSKTYDLIYGLTIFGLFLLFIGIVLRQRFEKINFEKENLLNIAHHDPLTNLPNRILLNSRFEITLENRKRSGGYLAVLFIDLNDFKKINDVYGHQVGDIVLKKVATQINKIRNTDTVCRLSGDEFLVILGEIKASDEAKIVAEQIIERIKSIKIDKYPEIKTSASIGISIYPHDGQDIETLIQNADTAMYQAKKDKRADYKFYR